MAGRELSPAFTFKIERTMSMDETMETGSWPPEHVREYLRSLGFLLPLEAMEGYVHMRHEWMQSVDSFYDYCDTDGFVREGPWQESAGCG
jgi:hypothetical protein